MTNTTKSLCDFMDASPTAGHAADNIAAYLSAHGAARLEESEAWKLEPGAAYFVARGNTAVVAFRPGFRSLGATGYILAGAHTDSPCLKARLGPERVARSMVRIPVDVYGGAILSGWLDRPLALAGSVVLREGEGGNRRLRRTLYNSRAAVGVIPNLPIHLNREINKGVEYNAHQHLPVLVDVGWNASGNQDASGAAFGSPWLEAKVASDLGVPVQAIAAMDLSFCDAQGAVLLGGGEGRELVNSPRLDDLAGCHAILEAFCASAPSPRTQMACFLDAEEVGSMTAQGANSNFVRDMLARINIAMQGGAEDFYRAGALSLCVSVDAAQAWNPAYTDKYDEAFSPLLGKGPAVKVSANQRYATDAFSESAFGELCRKASVPWQKYMSRADIQPGTTIGPMSSSRLGVRTIDIGHPLLAMHAVRETIDGSDHQAMIEALKAVLAESPDA